MVFEDFESEIDEEYWRKYQSLSASHNVDLKPGSMTRDLTEAEVDSLNQEMEDTLTSFHFKDLPTWLTKNIHEETTTKSGDAC